MVDMISTSADVRLAARDFLPFAAFTPLVAAPAFLFDGVFIGATWTRGMRDAMAAAVVCGALAYLALKPWGNAGLWMAFLAFLALRGVMQGALFRRLEAATFAPGAPRPL